MRGAGPTPGRTAGLARATAARGPYDTGMSEPAGSPSSVPASAPPPSSRGRYVAYRKKVRARSAKKAKADANGAAAAHKPEHRGRTADGGKSTHRTRPFGTLLRAFWGELRGHRGTLAVALVTASASTLLSLVPLYSPKLVFDNVLDTKPLSPRLARWVSLPTDPRRLLTVIGLTMIAVTVASVLLSMWGRWQMTRVTKRVQATYRRRVFEHAVRLPLHRVYELKSGGVASILREDAGGVGELVFSMVYNPAKAIVQLAGSLVILSFVNWRLLLGGLLLLPTVWLTHRTWIGRIRPLFRDIRNTRQGIDAHAAEAFGGIRVVRAFGRRRAEAGRFVDDNHLMARQELFAWWWMRGVDIAWALLIPLASALLLWYGGGQVLTDNARVKAGTLDPHAAFTTGDLIMFLSYLTALLGPIAALAESATGWQNQLAGFDRTLDLTAEPAEMPATPNSVKVSKETVAGRVTLRDVSFAYAAEDAKGSGKGGKPGASGRDAAADRGDGVTSDLTGHGALVLQGVNVDVRPGQVVALVGPSGAGKTTLCNLVARFYDPTGGAVLLDGRDLRDIDADSYRRLLGIVEQDTFLFDGSIADNIAYGARDATRPAIADAARRANAAEFVERLPDAYDTLIGERGVKLSGGQRQRLTIARAILADPKILILDEATSNLDTESERLIQASLAELMAGRTSFVIAHRLSTIRHADRILVLEGGRVVEEGTHDELMAGSGRYRQMVDLQTRPPEAVRARSVDPASGNGQRESAKAYS
ncbi:MAG: putative multidrug export ATP-binding/permease protein [Phycisphaerales bacterium]|nr:putative multidrug export ATP-binding/permease protein [Phycisphaerales bacterium]